MAEQADLCDSGDLSVSMLLSDSVAEELEQLVTKDNELVAQIANVGLLHGSENSPCTINQDPDARKYCSSGSNRPNSDNNTGASVQVEADQNCSPGNNISDDNPGASVPVDADQTVVHCSLQLQPTQFINPAATVLAPLEANQGTDVEGSLLRVNSRKRKREPEKWKRAILKGKRESGQAYTNVRGKEMPARSVKPVDCSACRLHCSNVFSEEKRHLIFDHFWSLTDDGKGSFYSKFTERIPTARKRTDNEESRKKFSYSYFLECDGVKRKVCKPFFLATLDICQIRVAYFHSHLIDNESGVPLERKKGKYKKKCIDSEMVEGVKQHIDSFPRIESHYCRQKTKRQYLDSNLNIAHMFDLYVTNCQENGKSPVKIHKYREIFNHDFNLAFIMPKSDRCDRCEEYKMDQGKGKILNEEEKQSIDRHLFLKNDAYEERMRDRTSEKIVLSFDMQNVIQLPRSNVSNFYYKRKLSLFNLTVHSSLDKTVYCCLWPEHLAGRGGNEIASGLLRVLTTFVENNPLATEIILWSDSCVPQNRNSIMAYALTSFMRTYPHVKKITQKYSESGHSQIQEVDNAHSVIEKALRMSEVYSPLSLVRILTTIRKKPPLKVLQMRKTDFFLFDQISKKFTYSKVPFSKVKQIMYISSHPSFVFFKDNHSSDFSDVSIVPPQRNQRKKNVSKNNNVEGIVQLNGIPLTQSTPSLGKEKVNDLKSMLKYMPAVDVEYFDTILK